MGLEDKTDEYIIPSNGFIRIAGGIFLLTGFVILYLSFFGRNLYYTQTYNNLVKFLPPVIDIWIFLTALMLLAQFSFFAIMPSAKFKSIELLIKNSRLRRIIGCIGLFVSIGVGSFIVLGEISKIIWLEKIIEKSQYFIPIAMLGALGLLAFWFATIPKATLSPKQATVPYRLGALLVSIILAIMIISMIEIRFTKKPTQQNLIPKISNTAPNPTHSISAILSDPPSRLAQGENKPIELKFRLSKFNPKKTARRYPLHLDLTHKYAVSVHIRSVGFDVSKLPDFLSKPQNVKVGELIKWDWIISPKQGTEGTEQNLIIDLFLHDQTDKKLVFQTPVTSLEITVGTPLKVPTWLLSPRIALVAIFLGTLSLMAPWVLSHFRLTLGNIKPNKANSADAKNRAAD